MSVNGELALSKAAVESRAATEPKAAPMIPQYATGFEGAAMQPFSDAATAVLAAPVRGDEVEIRTDGIVYLPGVAYRRILTRAFGAGAWALLPRGPARTMGELVVYHGALYILGRFVSEAVGECQTRGGMSYASSLEGARTDCLTRCCKDLGVAAELWDPAWREAWKAQYAVNNGGKWYLKNRARTGEGRNVGLTSKYPTACSVCGRPIQPGTPASQASLVDADTGEAPDEDTVTGIRNAVKGLRWKGTQAKSWLKGAFGVDSPDALTARQAADALQLLIAAQTDDGDATYNDVRAKLVADGRVQA